MPDERLRPQERVSRGADYQRAFRKGSRIDGQFFLLVAAENSQGLNRLGLAAGRAMGPAARRNRAKRLLREVFRRNKFEDSLDLILVPKADMAGRSLAEVEREYRARLRRLASRRSPDRRGPRRPPAD